MIDWAKKTAVLICAVCCLITARSFADTLLIVAESFPPYEFMENDQVVGIDVEITRHILNKMGVEHEFKILPWKRAWAMLEDGDAHMGLSVSKKSERTPYVYYPDNHLWDASFVFLTNETTKSTYAIKHYDDIKANRLRVGVTSGNSYDATFWEAFPWQDTQQKRLHPLLRRAPSLISNLKKLEVNRINVFPVVKTIGLYNAKELGLEGITFYDTVLFSKPYPAVFSKKATFHSPKYPDILAVMRAYDSELGKLKKTPQFQAFLKNTRNSKHSRIV